MLTMFSEKTFKSLFNNSVDAIFVVDAEKERIISANEIFRQVTGYNEDEAKNLTFKDLHPEADLSRALECFRESASGRPSIARDLAFRKKNGSIFHVDIIPVDMCFDEKKYLMGIFRDVKSRKKIKDELALKSVILETQLEMALDGILVLDDKGNILLTNKRAYDMWNIPQKLRDSYDYEEGSQYILSMLKEPEKYAGMFKDLYKNKEEKQRVEFELKDGRIFDRYSAPMLDNNGNCLGRIWFFRDISDYKKMQRGLKESEERFRLAMEAASDALWDLNLVTKRVFRNRAFFTMLGYEPGELADFQIEWAERIHPDDKPCVMKSIDEIMQSKSGAGEIQYRLRKKSGEYIWVLGRGKVVEHDENGTAVRMIGTYTDITEQKKMEDELAAERNKLRSIMKVIDQAITIFDLDYTVVYLNDYAKKFNAVREGEKCYRVFAGQDEICDECLVEMVYKDGKSHSSTKLITLPSGENIWWENTATPIRDDSGKMIHCLEVGKDVTERMKAQDAQRQSEERFRNIVENAGLGMSIFDENGRILYMNDYGIEVLGYSGPKVLTGKTLWDIFPKEIADRRASVHRQVAETGQGITIRKMSVQGQGREYFFDVFIEPLSSAADKVKSVLTIGKDITEIKQAEDKLDEYREKMSHAEQLASLGTLSAEAAHELAQPLTVLGLSIENALAELRKSPFPNTVVQKLETCRSEVSHIRTVLDKFRNFARKSSHTSFSETDFQAVAEMNASLLKESAERAKVTLSIEGLDALPHTFANEKDMQQLFFCLMENAIQAADKTEEHRLVIAGALQNEQIELRFCDNCGGIAPKHLNRIFEPFFTTKSIDQGTGLGLCIVQDIVSRAGGKIRVESKWPEGSTFFVTLPVNGNKSPAEAGF